MDAPGRLTYSSDELLTDLPCDEPLVAGGGRCHGGFRGGAYISPRTCHRGPAIEA